MPSRDCSRVWQEEPLVFCKLCLLGFRVLQGPLQGFLQTKGHGLGLRLLDLAFCAGLHRVHLAMSQPAFARVSRYAIVQSLLGPGQNKGLGSSWQGWADVLLAGFCQPTKLSKSWRLAVGRARCWHGLVFDIQSWFRTFALQKRTVMDDRTTTKQEDPYHLEAYKGDLHQRAAPKSFPMSHRIRQEGLNN